MDNFKLIYKILRMLEEAMDYDEFDGSLLNHEFLGVTENRMNAILKMLQDERYITGIIYRRGLSGVKLNRPAITLKGLEYLEKNSTMKKAAGLLKGIKEDTGVVVTLVFFCCCGIATGGRTENAEGKSGAEDKET